MAGSAHEFYVVGGTLRSDASSYVARRADRDLYESLSRGLYCSVLSSRQIGKSSLMVRTATRLRDDGVAVAVVDLTAIGQNLTAAQWYATLVSLVGEELGLEEELEAAWARHSKSGPLRRWVLALTDVVFATPDRRFVVFLDEIEAVRSLPFSTDEFFAALRELYNRRATEPELDRLAFCLVGVATPADLVRDPETTPFNIGARVELRDFTAEEAMPLARGLGRPEHTSATLLRRVLYWTGGHPYMTQRLCRAVAEDASVRRPRDVDRLCRELFLSPIAHKRDTNLLFVRDRLLRADLDLATLLTLYARVRAGRRVPYDEADPNARVLRLSGIVAVAKGRMHVRNRIYSAAFGRSWIAASMPDAEVRRQRAAYRRGLLETTAVAAVIMAVVSLLAIRLVRALAEVSEQKVVADARAVEAETAKQAALNVSAELEKSMKTAEAATLDAEQAQLNAEARQLEALEASGANRALVYATSMNLAQKAWEAADVRRVRALLDAQQQATNLRNFEWDYLDRLTSFGRPVSFDATVTAVAYAPDGRRLAIGTADGAVLVHEVSNGRTKQIGNHDEVVSSLCFSRNGALLASASFDHTAMIWDVTGARRPERLPRHASHVNAIALSADGRYVATGSDDQTVGLWDRQTGEALPPLEGRTEQVTGVAFAGNQLAITSVNGTLLLWDVPGGGIHELPRWSAQALTCVAASADGTRIAAGNVAGEVLLWNVTTGGARPVGTHGAQVTAVAFSPQNDRVASVGRDRVLRVWDLDTTAERAYRGHADIARSVAFSPDGRQVATGSADKTVRLWDVTVAQDASDLASLSSGVASIAFSPTGEAFPAGGGEAAAISADARVRAVGRRDGTVSIVDAASGRSHQLDGDFGWVTALALSPDASRIAVGTRNGPVVVCDTTRGRSRLDLKGHDGEVTCVAFSPDGRSLASASVDGTARLWDPATGAKGRVFSGHDRKVTCVAFSPDGEVLATACEDGAARLWRIRSSEPPDLLVGHGGPLTCIAFSPDGRRLVTASDDHTAKLWDVETRQEVLTLASADIVTAVAFSRDGRSLATGSENGRVRVYRAAKGGA